MANLSQNYAVDLQVEDLMFQANADDELLKLAPITSQDTALVQWDMRDNHYGLMNARGLEGTPEVTDVPGVRRYGMAPGYYGEKIIIGETEMTVGREPGTPNLPVNPETLIDNGVKQLWGRALDQIRAINSALFRTGKFMTRSRTGAVVHSDTLVGYNLLAPTTGWAASPSTATPIDDLLGWQNTLNAGTSSKFRKDSYLLCQQSVLNDLLATTQIRSTIKLEFGRTIVGLEDVNTLFANFGLPAIRLYDEGYYPTKLDAKNRTNFTKHLPVKSLIWVGTRPMGQMAAKFVMTRNMVNNPPPGYEAIDNQARDGLKMQGLYTYLQYHGSPPPRFELDMGFNGGPAVIYPSAYAGISYS